MFISYSHNLEDVMVWRASSGRNKTAVIILTSALTCPRKAVGWREQYCYTLGQKRRFLEGGWNRDTTTITLRNKVKNGGAADCLFSAFAIHI